MADFYAPLWKFNFAKLIVVDVTDDYRLMQPPLPCDFYPVVKELWMPRQILDQKLVDDDLVQGYLYDWHETPKEEGGYWYVGVVDEKLIDLFMHKDLSRCPRTGQLSLPGL